MFGSEAKLEALADVLDDHCDERIIVFTAHNDLAYDVSERFLVPTITHQTGTTERREILERFREGTYTRSRPRTCCWGGRRSRRERGGRALGQRQRAGVRPATRTNPSPEIRWRTGDPL